MDTGNFMSLEQRQQLSQAQIQGLEILAMDNVELNEFMQNEYLENPILEYQAGGEPPGTMEDFRAWYDKNRFSYKGEEAQFHEEDRDGREEAPAQEESIRDYLKAQLDPWRYGPDEKAALEFLLDSLDDNGFFMMEAKEVAALIHVEEKTVADCLEDLRQLEPYGIFARDLPHCLLRQLEVQGLGNEDLEYIILHRLKDIGEGRYSVISRERKLTTLQVRKYAAVIAGLNPRPMAGFHTGDTSYIIPDIILTYENGGWQISLNDKWLGDYRLSDYYMHMMKETNDRELFEYFKKKLERARFLLQSIEQRRETMRRIAEALAAWQEDYFLGRGELKPMGMAEVAQAVQVHPSTVSRGIKGKYIQYPHGTVLLKQLFSQAVGSAGAEDGWTAAAIKKRICELIDREDKKKPYSDQKLADLLNSENIVISRRAVAKYREETGIRGSFERKEIE